MKPQVQVSPNERIGVRVGKLRRARAAQNAVSAADGVACGEELGG